MKHILITSSHFQTTTWPGGTTTELFIFPTTANYKDRNFQFRLSTATVEVNQSDFTLLNGFSRKLMILNGSVTLNHENHHSVQLNKFEVYSFEGDWKTSCMGKCTDFNLMTGGKLKGKLMGIALNKGEVTQHLIRDNCNWLFIYVYFGNVSVEMNEEIISIDKGDLLVINQISAQNLQIQGIENSELVVAEITNETLYL